MQIRNMTCFISFHPQMGFDTSYLNLRQKFDNQ
ncbi:MAG: hypothetical protein METHSR3v1_1240002 [Methanothrix sp.]|nr:MAG: hypothetical protein METHSR3v1_1240002 [Methanothrix sp.]